jgi:hypothetical protein
MSEPHRKGSRAERRWTVRFLFEPRQHVAERLAEVINDPEWGVAASVFPGLELLLQVCVDVGGAVAGPGVAYAVALERLRVALIRAGVLPPETSRLDTALRLLHYVVVLDDPTGPDVLEEA